MTHVFRALTMFLLAALVAVAAVPLAAPSAVGASLTLDRSEWAVSSSGAWMAESNAVDGDPSTSWLSDGDQRDDMWFAVDAGAPVTFDAVELAQSGVWSNTYPRAYVIETSNDGAAWSVVASGEGSLEDQVVELTETATARHVRVSLTQSLEPNGGGWAIGELNLLLTVDAPQATLSTTSVRPGATIAINGDSFPEGEYRIELRPHGAVATNEGPAVTVDADGVLIAEREIPAATTAGTYDVVAVGAAGDAVVLPLTVTNVYVHDRSDWMLSASGTWIALANAVDGKTSTSWLGNGDQYEGMWLQVDAGEPVTFDVIGLAQSGEWTNAYPRAYIVEVSADGSAWTEVGSGTGSYEDQRIELDSPVTGRFVRITLTESVASGGGGWAVAELDLVYSDPQPVLTTGADRVNAGRSLTVDASYLRAGEHRLVLRANGVPDLDLVSFTARDEGHWSDDVIVPEAASVGPASLVLLSVPGDMAEAEASLEIDPVAPDEPGRPTIDYAAGVVSLAWDPVAAAVAYRVERATGKYSQYELVAELDGTAITDDVAHMDRYDYYYRVRAISAFDGVSIPSLTASLETELFGEAMNFFSPTDDPALIDALTIPAGQRMKPMTEEFSDERIVYAFKPGQYETSKFEVSYYTSVYGLGDTPLDTVIPNVEVRSSGEAHEDGNALTNFWRSIENIGIAPGSAPADCASPGSVIWGASQAAPARRLWIDGDLQLDHCSKAASGGFLADSAVEGITSTWAQQQYFLRNNSLGGGWQGGNWNIVFVGGEGSPDQSADWATVDRAWTVVDETPVMREKPFLHLREDGEYAVFVPAIRTNATGTSWSADSMGPGQSIPVSEFHVARPEVDDAASINAALADGKHLLLTPGIYEVDTTINVDRAGTVVLGLGMATIRPTGGNDAMHVADVDGVTIAGVLFDATAAGSDYLLQVGPAGASADHSGNPTLLADVFTRVGGAVFGKADTTVEINSADVIADHLWLWRADHGLEVTQGGERRTGWEKNTSEHGIVVNGDRVTAHGLFVEHFQGFQTLWTGDDGATYFYQSELPYDPTAQELWMSREGVNGFASYKVSNDAQRHFATGLGIYDVFLQTEGAWIELENAIEASPGTEIRHAATVSVTHPDYGGVGGIAHVVNGVGGSTIGTTVARQGVNLYVTPEPLVTVDVTGGTAVGGWYSAEVEVEFGLEDELSELEMNSAGAWERYDGAITLVDDGVHTVGYRVKHLGDLYAPVAGSVEVAIDATVPVVNHTATPEDARGTVASPVALQFSATDEHSGIDAIHFRIGGGQWADVPAGGLVIGDVGKHTVEYRAIDVAGNTSAPAAVTVTVRQGHGPQLTASETTLRPGDMVSVTATGLDGDEIEFGVASTYRVLTTALVVDGTATGTVTIPMDLERGAHHLQVRDGQGAVLAVLPITVLAAEDGVADADGSGRALAITGAANGALALLALALLAAGAGVIRMRRANLNS